MKKLIPILLLVAACASKEQHTAGSAAAEDTLNNLIKRRHIPGLAAVVSVNGQIVFAKGFGYANLEQQTPVDPEKSEFRIGSIAKLLTAVELGQLMEQQKIQPDSTVYFYLPDFPKKKWRPTVRQIAGHLGGVRHYRGEEMMSNKRYASVMEGLSIFKEDSLEFKPGTQYSYSSYGFNLLSAVMEKADGRDFLTMMRSDVIGKLGLTHTHADANDSIILNRTGFYVIDKGQPHNAPAVDNSYKWAGGGFVASATDLVRVGNALLSNTLLKPETLSQLTQRQVLADGKPSNYGMGFGIETDDKGNELYGHSGGSVGGTSDFSIYPKQKIVVVVLTNRSGANLGDVTWHLAQCFMP